MVWGFWRIGRDFAVQSNIVSAAIARAFNSKGFNRSYADDFAAWYFTKTASLAGVVQDETPNLDHSRPELTSRATSFTTNQSFAKTDIDNADLGVDDTDLTFSVWIRGGASLANDDRAVSTEDSSKGWFIGFEGPNLRVGIYDGSGTKKTADTGLTVTNLQSSDAKGYWVKGIYDHSESKLYCSLNAKRVDETACTGFTASTANTLSIGRAASGSARNWEGEINHCSVWVGEALSEVQDVLHWDRKWGELPSPSKHWILNGNEAWDQIGTDHLTPENAPALSEDKDNAISPYGFNHAGFTDRTQSPVPLNDYGDGAGVSSPARIETVFGESPAADDFNFPAYIEAWKSYRENELNFTADKILFVSSSDGDDSDSGLTQDLAVATIQQAQSIRDADSGSSYEIRIKGGDTFRVTDTDDLWDSTVDQTKITSYGSGRPTITRGISHTSGWTLDSGTRYSKAQSNEPIAIHIGTNYTQPLHEEDSAAAATTAAAVSQVYGSWYWDGADLFIDLDGTDPNSVTIEVYEQNNYHGFILSGDLCSVQNCVIAGFGAANGANQKQGVTLAQTDLHRGGCINCDVWFGGSHTLAVYSGTTGQSNGIVLFSGCKTGGAGYNGSANETMLNIYQDDGGTEVLIYDCEITLGTLPSYEWYAPDSNPQNHYRGIGLFGHVSGSGDPLRRITVYNSEGFTSFPDAYFAPSSPLRFSTGLSSPTFANRATSRFHAYNVKLVRSLGAAGSFSPSPIHHHKCDIQWKPKDSGTLSDHSQKLEGLHTSCLYVMDQSEWNSALKYGWTGSTSASDISFNNSTLLYTDRGSNSASATSHLNRSTGAVNGRFDNSVFGLIDSTGSGIVTLHVDFSDDNFSNNIVIGTSDDSYYDTSVNVTEVADGAFDPIVSPVVGDSRYQSGDPQYTPSAAFEGNQFRSDIGHLGSGSLVPAKWNSSLDADNEDRQYKGEVARNAQLEAGPSLTLDGTEYGTNASLTGSETVVSNGGTTTPTITAGRIDFTAGTLWNLVLSNGSVYHCSEQYGGILYDTVNENHLTLFNSPTRSAVNDGHFIGESRGYSLYEHASTADILVPLKSDGTALTITPPSGYSKAGDYPAGPYHNNTQATLQGYMTNSDSEADIFYGCEFDGTLDANINADTAITGYPFSIAFDFRINAAAAQDFVFIGQASDNYFGVGMSPARVIRIVRRNTTLVFHATDFSATVDQIHRLQVQFLTSTTMQLTFDGEVQNIGSAAINFSGPATSTALWIGQTDASLGSSPNFMIKNLIVKQGDTIVNNLPLYKDPQGREAGDNPKHGTLSATGVSFFSNTPPAALNPTIAGTETLAQTDGNKKLILIGSKK